MPKTKSAKKALRQSRKRELRNLVYKRKIKKLTREIKKAIEKKEIEKAKNLLSQFYKVIDKAVKIKFLKKRAAARKKSKLAKLLAQASKTN